jgi:hypothetical protein
MGKNYDSDIAGFLRGKVAPGAVCFDVGANLGAYVLQFAELSKPNGTVVAFEPNPYTVTANVWESAGTTKEQAISVIRKLNLDMVPLSGQHDPLGEHGSVMLAASTRTTAGATRGLSEIQR